jgi:hypothetical protein
MGQSPGEVDDRRPMTALTPRDRVRVTLAGALALALCVAYLFVFGPYRKFVVNEWRERALSGQAIVFVPDCPNNAGHFKCGDHYTIEFRKTSDKGWRQLVRRNDEQEQSEICGADPDAGNTSWRSFKIGDVQVAYSWRGRAVILGVSEIGWLMTPEAFAARQSRRLKVQ